MKINGTGPLKDCVLEFNGHSHKLNVVMAKAGSAPLVEVKVSDIDLDASRATRTEYHEVDDLEPAVIKHGGKYLVLVGRDRIMNTNNQLIKVRLVTSVALKSARIVEAQAEPERTPFNPPRFTDNRRFDTASAGPSHERTRTFDHVRQDSGRPQHSTPRFERHETPRPFNAAPSSDKRTLGERVQSPKPFSSKKRFA